MGRQRLCRGVGESCRPPPHGGGHRTGDIPTATRLLQRALAIYQEIGDRIGEADALQEPGRVRYLARNIPAATSLLERALAIYQDVGYRLGEAEALNSAGAVLAESTGPHQALLLYRRALHLARQTQSPLEEARALQGAAYCTARTRDQQAALSDLWKAAAIYVRTSLSAAIPTTWR